MQKCFKVHLTRVNPPMWTWKESLHNAKGLLDHVLNMNAKSNWFVLRALRPKIIWNSISILDEISFYSLGCLRNHPWHLIYNLWSRKNHLRPFWSSFIRALILSTQVYYCINMFLWRTRKKMIKYNLIYFKQETRFVVKTSSLSNKEIDDVCHHYIVDKHCDFFGK